MVVLHLFVFDFITHDPLDAAGVALFLKLSIHQCFSHSVSTWVTSMKINSLQSQCLFWIHFWCQCTRRCLLLPKLRLNTQDLLMPKHVSEVRWLQLNLRVMLCNLVFIRSSTNELVFFFFYIYNFLFHSLKASTQTLLCHLLGMQSWLLTLLRLWRECHVLPKTCDMCKW